VTDVIVIGGGLNGLVTAALVAKAKRSVILIDQCPDVGGAAITADFEPGFRVPRLAHSVGPVSREVVKALRLDRVKGLEFITPNPSLTTINGAGHAVVFHPDQVLTAASINQISASDAGRWREFLQCAHRVASVLSKLNHHAPPDMDDLQRGDRWFLVSVARSVKRLSKRDLARLLRWTPMAIGDLVSEWFESEVVRAAIAAHAIAGNPAGPRSAGTGAMWLQRLSMDQMPVGSGVTLKGGPGALTAAVAKIATDAGASVRSNARAVRIVARNGQATGVVLENGDELSARAIVSAISPKAALCGLVPAADLPPSFLQRIRNIRSRGVTAKINLALSALPAFTAIADDAAALGGRLLVAPDLDYLERAFDATKYGRISSEPSLELAVPSVRDNSLAPAGAHVMSITAHFAPRDLRGTTWAQARETLWNSVLRVLEAQAPGLSNLIVGRELLTPEDIEQRWGLPGGHIFHGEMTIDQSWAARPLLGWARYRTPIAGLFLASAGAHPGGGLTGLPGHLASQAVLEDLKRRRP
jgi:phytoene dehydrogenase-like protein